MTPCNFNPPHYRTIVLQSKRHRHRGEGRHLCSKTSAFVTGTEQQNQQPEREQREHKRQEQKLIARLIFAAFSCVMVTESTLLPRRLHRTRQAVVADHLSRMEESLNKTETGLVRQYVGFAVWSWTIARVHACLPRIYRLEKRSVSGPLLGPMLTALIAHSGRRPRGRLYRKWFTMFGRGTLVFASLLSNKLTQFSIHPLLRCRSLEQLKQCVETPIGKGSFWDPTR
jgi:hypothetical protein